VVVKPDVLRQGALIVSLRSQALRILQSALGIVLIVAGTHGRQTVKVQVLLSRLRQRGMNDPSGRRLGRVLTR